VNANDRAELAERLHAFMRRVTAHAGTSALAVADELGLSSGDLRVVLLLSHEAAPVSISEVADRLRASQPTASRLVASVVRRGLVCVEPARHDRRARQVELSPAGRELVARLRAARVADVRRFVDDLPEEQAARLSDVLGVLDLDLVEPL
jgi:DNA-binding MarR family transcriptional regulator